MIRQFRLTFIVLIVFQYPLIGSDKTSLEKNLDKFFDSFGSSANVSSAEVYQGQKAGYGTGGNVSVRNPINNLKPATINLPKIDAGCGGIDIYAGGFSFVNSENLKNNAQAIASSSLGYAFMLGVESVSPIVANNIKTMQSWANDINGLGINSCETAAKLVGSVWPQNDMASQHVCRTLGTVYGYGDSYIDSRHQCSTKKSNENEFDPTEAPPDLLYGEYNLAWKAIQQNGFLSKHPTLAEIFMTITGTIVVKETNGEEHVLIYPSKITDESLLKSILEGGTCTIYSCIDPKKQQCLTISEHENTFTTEHSWTGKVKNNLETIQNKIFNDEELDPSEIAFLASSNLPLYRIVNVLSAYKHGVCGIDLLNLSDIIAMDMLLQSLKNGILSIREGCLVLKSKQMYSNTIDEYLVSLDRVLSEIKYYETRAMQKINRDVDLMKKIDLIEQQIFQETFP